MSEGLIDRLNAALSHRTSVERERGERDVASVCPAKNVRHDRSVAVEVDET